MVSTKMTDAGFQILEQVISIGECEELTAELASYRSPKMRAGIRNLMANQKVSSLASDERLLGIAREFLGGAAVPYKATLFDKSHRANWLVAWHQDTALPLETQVESSEWGPWSLKGGINYAIAPRWALERVVALRVHLDPSTEANGPLRVIAGSHKNGILDDEQAAVAIAEGRVIECLIPRGGILVMRPLLLHASSKCTSNDPRRVLHIEYADALDLKPGIRLAIS